MRAYALQLTFGLTNGTVVELGPTPPVPVTELSVGGWMSFGCTQNRGSVPILDCCLSLEATMTSSRRGRSQRAVRHGCLR